MNTAIYSRGALVASAFILAAASSLGAQIATVVHGRAEDALTGDPVAEAEVFPIDSSIPVYTDSLGAFAVPFLPGQPLIVRVERQGYLRQQFELDPSAPSRISVLQLEPAPIVLEGVTAVQASAVDRLLRDLHNRRNFYPGSVAVLDRAQLDRFFPVGSVWDVIRQRYSGVFECSVGRSRLCVRGRSRSFTNPNPENPVLVCVDGWESWGAASELSSLDISSVALLEVYGRGGGGIRVYTAPYVAHVAITGQWIAKPLQFGC